MNDLNWEGLRYFIAAAESGSLSAAAQQTGANQSTVSRHIDALESTLGAKLFSRSVRGLRLTPTGKAIFEQALGMDRSAAKILRVLEGEQEEARGSVRLSLPEGLGQEVLIPQLDDFYRLQPKVKLVFNVSATTTRFTEAEADVAVCLFQPEESSLVTECPGEMRLGLYASAAYLARHGQPKAIRDLRKHRVITYGDHLSILPENQWLLNHTDEALRALSSDSTLIRFKAARAGLGISLQPVVLAQTDTRLVHLFKSVKLPAYKVWLAYREDDSQLPRIRAVVSFISACLGRSLKR